MRFESRRDPELATHPSPNSAHRNGHHSTKVRCRRKEGPKAMITGLRGTSIWSEDLNNLLPFYRDVLGLEVTTETPGFVVLGGLWLGSHSDVHGRNADPARHMIGLTSNDLMGDWKRLKDAGVEFVEDPTDYGTVWIATLKDPEGNLVQLLQSSR
jgi:predicted enzyme related to lactoylglutathione lyase